MGMSTHVATTRREQQVQRSGERTGAGLAAHVERPVALPWSGILAVLRWVRGPGGLERGVFLFGVVQLRMKRSPIENAFGSAEESLDLKESFDAKGKRNRIRH